MCIADSWLKEVVKRRKQLTAQFHDEGAWEIKKGNRDKCTSLLQESIGVVNDNLKLNVALGIDVKYGDNYAEVH